MKCLCGGRGWIIPPKEQWWKFCPHCRGRGQISMRRASKLLGVCSATLKKLVLGLPISLRSCLRVIDRYQDMAKMIDRRQT